MHKPSLESQDDSLLVQGTLEGDPLCFEVLVERYQRRLFGLVRHYTRSAVEVEDIVQDTFLKAFSRLETFQQSSALPALPMAWEHPGVRLCSSHAYARPVRAASQKRSRQLLSKRKLV